MKANKSFENKKKLKIIRSKKYYNKSYEENKIKLNYWKYISILFIILFNLIQKK